jgi:hypothetical protein
MVENDLRKISYEEIDDDVTRHNRMRILINIARNQGQKGINFIKSIDIDE